jgi:anti-anti-sigma factor
MSDVFQIHTLHSSTDVLTVSVIGELDAFTANQLRLALAGWEFPIAECVVDLSRVTFMDSSGLKELIAARQHLHERSATVRLSGAQGQVERLLRMTGVDELFSTPAPT